MLHTISKSDLFIQTGVHPTGAERNEKRCGESFLPRSVGPNAAPGEFPWNCIVVNQDEEILSNCAIIPNNNRNDIATGTDRVVTTAHKLRDVKQNELVD